MRPRARRKSSTLTSRLWRERARAAASPSATSRRPPRKTSSLRVPGGPAFSIKRAAKLKTKKYREAERLFLAEGTAVLAEAPTTPLHVFDREEQILRVSTLETQAGPVGVFPFLDVTVTELLSRAWRILLLHGVQEREDPDRAGL